MGILPYYNNVDCNAQTISFNLYLEDLVVEVPMVSWWDPDDRKKKDRRLPWGDDDSLDIEKIQEWIVLT